MNKRVKRLARVFANPPPKDLGWDEAFATLEEAGFKASCKGGSHYNFYHDSGFTFRMSKTHPSGILKPYQVKAMKQAIESVSAGIGSSYYE